LYNIQPGNRAGQFLQPWSLHGADDDADDDYYCYYYYKSLLQHRIWQQTIDPFTALYQTQLKDKISTHWQL